ncbi:MAG: lipopolysaccharide core heptose(I) kinase RfaP [gamma proteobacterium symbiont of Bathyaustriella thionipta]|nr:lipopolysaccharide core heptose(I) kinase RfaP [gamma proteobacterium symbiont of Bathyaustriella thionipta]MCU7948678.1 lipopolysaccharide core heptose(I) kinase RfaP [gamma proteobacterium symbiont of Bathyaustriella thionipta]MCU7952616.1 lipopolysaccharide core heptose(I) kinase RfaP [gamma proteobacterium symbiont of Bathyaustriella thionipta]MCU7955113.1 lipopolysaccharide core heptose(I) kinase RfaP [gamma proteobacterium symbiont of Bathyaustriella thionipta]MCU7967730.1 lipopolysacc
MHIELSKVFAQQWKNKDPFTEAETLQGEVFRALEARKTLRFTLQNHSYFIKIHRGVGWFEIIENLIRLRLPVLGAKNEYLAIKKLEQLHIDTMRIAGYALKGNNPAKQQSFIITEDLINTISLEDFCADWLHTPPDFRLKQTLISKLAHISRTMHDNGINHRDFYICHFLMDKELMDKRLLEACNNKESPDYQQLKVSLIDLHRAQLRQQTPERWRVKDIASLYFSAMNIGMTQRDFFRFMKGYNNSSLRDCLTKYADFWRKVELQGQKLWRRKQRKGDAI